MNVPCLLSSRAGGANTLLMKIIVGKLMGLSLTCFSCSNCCYLSRSSFFFSLCHLGHLAVTLASNVAVWFTLDLLLVLD